MEFSSLRLKGRATITMCEVLPRRLESKILVVRQKGERNRFPYIPHYLITVHYTYSIAGGQPHIEKETK